MSDPALGSSIALIANRNSYPRYVPGAHGFDALLVGIYENKRLIFEAKVKNGFVSLGKDEIFSVVKKFGTPKCPFTNLPKRKRHGG